MKIRLWLTNLGLVIYLAGLLLTIGIGIQSGAINSTYCFSTYRDYLPLPTNFILQKIKVHFRFCNTGHLIRSYGHFYARLQYINRYDVIYNIELFTSLYLCAGWLLLVIFLYYSIKSTRADSDKGWVIVGASIAFLMGRWRTFKYWPNSATLWPTDFFTVGFLWSSFISLFYIFSNTKKGIPKRKH